MQDINVKKTLYIGPVSYTHLISLLLVFVIVVFLIALSMSGLSYWESQLFILGLILVMIIAAPLFLLLVIAQFRFAAALRASAKGPVLKPNGLSLIHI